MASQTISALAELISAPPPNAGREHGLGWPARPLHLPHRPRAHSPAKAARLASQAAGPREARAPVGRGLRNSGRTPSPRRAPGRGPHPGISFCGLGSSGGRKEHAAHLAGCAGGNGEGTRGVRCEVLLLAFAPCSRRPLRRCIGPTVRHGGRQQAQPGGGRPAAGRGGRGRAHAIAKDGRGDKPSSRRTNCFVPCAADPDLAKMFGALQEVMGDKEKEHASERVGMTAAPAPPPLSTAAANDEPPLTSAAEMERWRCARRGRRRPCARRLRGRVHAVRARGDARALAARAPLQPRRCAPAGGAAARRRPTRRASASGSTRGLKGFLRLGEALASWASTPPRARPSTRGWRVRRARCVSLSSRDGSARRRRRPSHGRRRRALRRCRRSSRRRAHRRRRRRGASARWRRSACRRGDGGAAGGQRGQNEGLRRGGAPADGGCRDAQEADGGGGGGGGRGGRGGARPAAAAAAAAAAGCSGGGGSSRCARGARAPAGATDLY